VTPGNSGEFTATACSLLSVAVPQVTTKDAGGGGNLRIRSYEEFGIAL
jgi:hypothetical protein